MLLVINPFLRGFAFNSVAPDKLNKNCNTAR